MRLPRELPAQAVRRVVCERCKQPFACDAVDAVLDVGVLEPVAAPKKPRTRWIAGTSLSAWLSDLQGWLSDLRERLFDLDFRGWLSDLRGWLSDPESNAWRYLSIPIAAAAVIVALVLIQGSGEPARHSASSAAPAAPEPTQAGGNAAPTQAGSNAAEVIKGSSFTLALPPGWQRTEPGNGATFTAASSDGGADATLWISRDPQLSYPDFEARSLAQLHTLAGSAHVVNRVTAPTADGTIVTLAADSPPDQPAYEVTLRVAGPYRYYLATTVNPNASQEAVGGADLIHNSFVPTTTSSSQ